MSHVPATSRAPARRSPASRTERQDAVAAKVASALAILEHEVTALRSGEDWQRYLELFSKMDAYGPRNIVLVARVGHVEAAASREPVAPLQLAERSLGVAS